MLTDIPFYKALTEEEKRHISESAYTVSYKRGTLIHSHGDPCLGMMRVTGGKVGVSILSEEGREATIFFLTAGMTCVLSSVCILRHVTADVYFSAETDTVLDIVPPQVMARILRENRTAECEILRMTSETFSAITSHMQDILFRSVDSRIADVLLREAEETKSRELHLTHEQIARYIGSAREVVTRILRKFRELGAIRVSHGTVEILSESALKQIESKQ